MELINSCLDFDKHTFYICWKRKDKTKEAKQIKAQQSKQKTTTTTNKKKNIELDNKEMH